MVWASTEVPVKSQQNRIGFRNETELFTVQKKKGHGVANLYVSVLLYLISDTMGFFFFFFLVLMCLKWRKYRLITILFILEGCDLITFAAAKHHRFAVKSIWATHSCSKIFGLETMVVGFFFFLLYFTIELIYETFIFLLIFDIYSS